MTGLLAQPTLVFAALLVLVIVVVHALRDGAGCFSAWALTLDFVFTLTSQALCEHGAGHWYDALAFWPMIDVILALTFAVAAVAFGSGRVRLAALSATYLTGLVLYTVYFYQAEAVGGVHLAVAAVGRLRYALERQLYLLGILQLIIVAGGCLGDVLVQRVLRRRGHGDRLPGTGARIPRE